MANSQIASSLRLKQKVEVVVWQQLGCDFVVSRRMGIDKKTVSDISNGANASKLTERIRSLCDAYQKPCVIIEKDRVKGNAPDKPSTLTKYYASVLSRLSLANVTILMSSSQEETAEILGKLSKAEAKEGHAIAELKNRNKRTEKLLKLLCGIHKITYPIAMELVVKHKSLGSLARCSLSSLKETLSFVPRQRVEEIYFLFRRKFDPGMMPC